MPLQLHSGNKLSASDCYKAFNFFDKDGSGTLEFEEIQKAFDLMMAPAKVSIDCYKGQDFSASRFQSVVEAMNNALPQYNIAVNLMKYIRENGDDSHTHEHVTNHALKRVFEAYDEDKSGGLSIVEIFQLFMYLKIPLVCLSSERGLEDGVVTFEEFETICDSIQKKHPGEGVHEKMTKLAGSLADAKPDLAGQGDPDIDNDPNNQIHDDAPPPMNKKALLIGINYNGSNCQLSGCINDVKKEKEILLTNFGFDESNILMLTEDQADRSKHPTAANMRQGVEWLIKGASSRDFLFFAYSGHGSQIPDTTGTEPDGLNEILCPLDLQDDWDRNAIQDDWLHSKLVDGIPDGCRCLCIYDCCHSGSMQDLSCTRAISRGDSKPRHLEPPDWIKTKIEENKKVHTRSLNPTQKRSIGESGKKCWTISGCQDNQTSADAFIDGQYQGAMTAALMKSLSEGGLKGPWTFQYEKLLYAMRAHLRDGSLGNQFEQIPALQATAPHLLDRMYLGNGAGR
jgi:Ca2+-binding EF-hand superfamily protein